MASYAKLPMGVTLNVQPFEAHEDEAKLVQLKKLLELSPVGPVTFENTNAGRKYGMRKDWLESARDHWLNDFDWRKFEARINSFANFKAPVKDGAGNDIDIQFLALFSERSDAVPLVLLHGWPGSICEFLDILDALRQKYSPADLPYHVIVPSLPGYAYSSGPPVDVDYNLLMATGAINKLMLGLGFGGGYLAQGGDLGSFVSRILAMTSPACKGIHLNMMGLPPKAGSSNGAVADALEERTMKRIKDFNDTASASTLEQGTRPATLGLALSASPLSLLSWVGEKFLEWSDEDPPLEKILEGLTLYWLTETFARCIYHNRGLGDPDETPKIARASALMRGEALRLPYIDKPCGYSHFAHEIIPIPEELAKLSCNLISYRHHESGGHFAAMEKPAELLADIEDFIKVWKDTTS